MDVESVLMWMQTEGKNRGGMGMMLDLSSPKWLETRCRFGWFEIDSYSL